MGKPTKKKILSALHETKGAVYIAAGKLGISAQTIYNYIDKYPEVKDVKEHYDGEMVDIGELKLRSAVIEGDPWAVKYTLSTKGKSRGYTERQELTGADGKDLQPPQPVLNIVVQNEAIKPDAEPTPEAG